MIKGEGGVKVEEVFGRRELVDNRLILDNSPQALKLSIFNHLRYSLATDFHTASKRDWWLATCDAVRDRIIERYICTISYHEETDVRRVYYLSLEYLMGRLLTENVNNMQIKEPLKVALQQFNQRYEELEEEEPDMGLGNGGLGRLASCYLDSLATLEYPAIGYGIYYEYGLFMQEIRECKQIEHPDKWQRFGQPWQMQRPDQSVEIQLNGSVEKVIDPVTGKERSEWVNTNKIIGMPWDVPVIGYNVETVNFLRLWEAVSSNEFDFKIFNDGGYVEAVRDKVLGEAVSKVLYPNDKTEMGKELRLVQQYFFVACSLRDIIARYQKKNKGWGLFSEKVCVQLNDTHPTLAIVELMRILIDEEGIEWGEAWKICRATFSYTNHTLLPEALECWSVSLFEKLLPRHLQIIYKINHVFLEEEVEKKWPGDLSKKRYLSIIDEGYGHKMIRMAYLAVIGSHTVNGVAALHTQLLKRKLFPDFCELYPKKMINITNGVTPRRWLMSANPELSKLITKAIGDKWKKDLGVLKGLESFQNDQSFLEEFLRVKQNNKIQLAKIIQQLTGITVDENALFDVQIKRIHEYKRQHLNLLHILSLYKQLLKNPDLDIEPRVFIFAGKAAPAYYLAKNIIHAINAIGRVINQDRSIKDKLKVVYLPNYGVTLASKIIPAADLSEQISTAGKEASGTGNMKLALNGALTIGTLDGANIEIKDAVGEDNIFIFGMTVEQVQRLFAEGYNPYHYYNSIPMLKEVVDWLMADHFSNGEQGAFMMLKKSLLDDGDRFLVMADFYSYVEKQKEVNMAFKQKKLWAKKALINTANMGYFSSDRAIQEYAEKIWNLPKIPSTCEL